MFQTATVPRRRTSHPKASPMRVTATCRELGDELRGVDTDEHGPCRRRVPHEHPASLVPPPGPRPVAAGTARVRTSSPPTIVRIDFLGCAGPHSGRRALRRRL